MISRILDEPPLVGREHELEILQSCLKSTMEGRGTTVFVTGEAGSGKTKLVTDFLNAARQKEQITTLSGWCLSDAGIPYFPFIEAFSNYYSKTKSAEPRELNVEEVEVNTWLKGPVHMGLSGTMELSPETWKDLTFVAVKKALTSISAYKPTVLFLDDIHWADSASLALLQYVSRMVVNEKVLVLATFRNENLKIDKEGRQHPLVDALRLMGRNSLFKEIKLFGLSENEVGFLAENMVGGEIQSSLAQKLEIEGQGNPLFVVESLRMLSEKNCLVIKNDRWCLSTDDVGIPSKIKDIILHRVSGLTHAQKKILDVASVIGSKFEPELLANVLGMDSIEVIETLDQISQASSLVSCDESHYKFDHAKSRDALYEEVSPALRKVYHGKIAERIEITSNGKQVSDLAYHFSEAGNKGKAVKYSLVAGAEALTFLLGTEAIKHFKYVLDNTADEPEYVTQREIAMEGLGEGLYANADGQAVKIFEQLSESTASSFMRARALRKAARASVVQGNYGHALDLVRSPIEDISSDRLENARFLAVRGMVEAWGAYINESIPKLESALQVFEEEYQLLDMIDVLTQIPIDYIMERAQDNPSTFEHPERALAAILRALELCKYTKNLSKTVDANAIAWVVYSKCALTKEAADMAKQSFETVQQIQDPKSRCSNTPWSAFMESFLAEISGLEKILSKLPLESMNNFGTGAKIKFYMSSFLSGALTEYRKGLKTAIQHGLEGARCGEETDFFDILALNYTNLTRQYAELGQMEQAQVYFDKMEKIFNETSLSGFMFAHAMHLFTKGVFFACKRQWNEANKWYDEALKYYLSVSPSTGIEAGIRRGYCWALLQQGRFEDAKKQFEASKKTISKLDADLIHTNIQGFLVAPARATVGQKFDMRLDIVNTAKNAGNLQEIKNFLPESFKIVSVQPLINLKENSIDLVNKQVKPFQDQAFTLAIRATEAGVFTLQPQIAFLDELGERKVCNVKPVTVTVMTTQPKVKGQNEFFTNASSETQAEIEILKRFGLTR